MTGTGGLVLEAFDAIDDFVGKVEDGTLDSSERAVHGSHLLVLLVESSLEALSSANLSTRIVGLSRRTEAQLVEERRKLEEANTRPEFQKLLYSFEPICRVVHEGGYGLRDEEESRRFFEQLFPEWLERLHAWATDEDLQVLADRVGQGQSAYQAVVDQIVSDHP